MGFLNSLFITLFVSFIIIQCHHLGYARSIDNGPEDNPGDYDYDELDYSYRPGYYDGESYDPEYSSAEHKAEDYPKYFSPDSQARPEPNYPQQDLLSMVYTSLSQVPPYADNAQQTPPAYNEPIVSYNNPQPPPYQEMAPPMFTLSAPQPPSYQESTSPVMYRTSASAPPAYQETAPPLIYEYNAPQEATSDRSTIIPIIYIIKSRAPSYEEIHHDDLLPQPVYYEPHVVPNVYNASLAPQLSEQEYVGSPLYIAPVAPAPYYPENPAAYNAPSAAPVLYQEIASPAVYTLRLQPTYYHESEGPVGYEATPPEQTYYQENSGPEGYNPSPPEASYYQQNTSPPSAAPSYEQNAGLVEASPSSPPSYQENAPPVAQETPPPSPSQPSYEQSASSPQPSNY